MSTTLTINVTQAHIDAGEKKQCARCPVALAMVDAGVTRVFASGALLNGLLNGVEVDADPPPEVEQFMFAFDAGQLVSPFGFDAEFREVPQDD
jgi:hypothetical protein